MRGPDPPTIWNVGKQGHSSDQHYLFLIIMAFSLCPSFMGHSKLKWPFFLQDQHSMFFRSFCTHFVLILLLKHILLRSISLFRLLFKSLFSFCLKKMVRSIIVKGGVSRERVVVKDSTSADFAVTDHDQSFWLSPLQILWKSSPSCLSAETRSSPLASCLEKNRCRRNFMFTIVTDSYILCGVSQISHADSMSPTETSTLSLTTISTASKNFFLLSTTIDAVHMLSFFVWLQQHHLIEEVISARSAGFSFLKNEKKKILFFEKQLHSHLPNIYI